MYFLTVSVIWVIFQPLLAADRKCHVSDRKCHVLKVKLLCNLKAADRKCHVSDRKCHVLKNYPLNVYFFWKLPLKRILFGRVTPPQTYTKKLTENVTFADRKCHVFSRFSL